MTTVMILQLISVAIFIIAMIPHFLTYKVENSKLSVCSLIGLMISFGVAISTILVGISSNVMVLWILYMIAMCFNVLSVVDRYIEIK